MANNDLDAAAFEIELERAANFATQLLAQGGNLEYALISEVASTDLTKNPLPAEFANADKQFATELWLESLHLGMNHLQATANVRLQLTINGVEVLKFIERHVRQDTLNTSEQKMMAELGDARFMQSHLREMYIAKLKNNYESGALLGVLGNRVIRGGNEAVGMYNDYVSLSQDVFDRAQLDAPLLGDTYAGRGHVVEMPDFLVGRGEVVEIDYTTQRLKEWKLDDKKEPDFADSLFENMTERQKKAEAVERVKAERLNLLVDTTITGPRRRGGFLWTETSRRPALLADRKGRPYVMFQDMIVPADLVNTAIAEGFDNYVEGFREELHELPDSHWNNETQNKLRDLRIKDEALRDQLQKTMELRSEAVHIQDVSRGIRTDPAHLPEFQRFENASNKITKAGIKIKGRK